MDLPSKHHARIPAPLNPWKPAAGASFRPRSASKLPTLTHTAFTKTHKMMCQLEIGRMMVVKNRLFLGDTERTIPRSRPAFRIAGSAGRVKGAKRDRSHAQRSEHGQDPPFDAPEHPATIASGWAGDPASACSGIYSVREAEARTEAIKKHAHGHWNSRMMFGWQLQRSESGGCGTRTRSAISGRNRRCGASSATRRPVSLGSPSESEAQGCDAARPPTYLCQCCGRPRVFRAYDRRSTWPFRSRRHARLCALGYGAGCRIRSRRCGDCTNARRWCGRSARKMALPKAGDQNCCWLTGSVDRVGNPQL